MFCFLFVQYIIFMDSLQYASFCKYFLLFYCIPFYSFVSKFQFFYSLRAIFPLFWFISSLHLVHNILLYSSYYFYLFILSNLFHLFFLPMYLFSINFFVFWSIFCLFILLFFFSLITSIYRSLFPISCLIYFSPSLFVIFLLFKFILLFLKVCSPFLMFSVAEIISSFPWVYLT